MLKVIISSNFKGSKQNRIKKYDLSEREGLQVDRCMLEKKLVGDETKLQNLIIITSITKVINESLI